MNILLHVTRKGISIFVLFLFCLVILTSLSTVSVSIVKKNVLCMYFYNFVSLFNIFSISSGLYTQVHIIQPVDLIHMRAYLRLR